MFFQLLLALLGGTLVYVFYVRSSPVPDPSGLDELVSPPGWPLLGNLPAYANHSSKSHYVHELHAKHGDVILFKFLGFPIIVTSRPEHVRLILNEHLRDDAFVKILSRVFGAGSVLVQEGPEWRVKRQLLNQGFHKNFMRTHVIESVRLAERRLAARLLAQIGEQSGSATAVACARLIRMDREFIQLTTAVIGLTTMDYSFHYLDENQPKTEPVKDEYLPLFAEIIAETGRMFSNPLRPLTSPLTQLSFRAALRRVRSFLDDQIQARLDQPQRDRTDVLGILIDALIQDKITREELVDNLWTFVFAGADTTAHTMAFCLYYVASNPDVEKKLLHEINEVFGSPCTAEQRETASPLTFEQMKDLPYLRCVILETLRLCPIAVGTSKSIPAGSTLFTKTPLEKDCVALVHYYSIHHNPDHWNDPERYDPDRHLPERASKRHSYAFVPFGGGPHICVGQTMALLEARFVLANFYWRGFRARLVPGHTYTSVDHCTMKEQHDMPLLISRE